MYKASRLRRDAFLFTVPIKLQIFASKLKEDVLQDWFRS